jgi:hypothetical protein
LTGRLRISLQGIEELGFPGRFGLSGRKLE